MRGFPDTCQVRKKEVFQSYFFYSEPALGLELADFMYNIARKLGVDIIWRNAAEAILRIKY